MARRHGITALARRRKRQSSRVLRVPHFGRSALVQGAGQRGENSFLYFGAHADTSAASSSGERRDPSSWIRCPSALTSLPAALKKRPPCSVSSSFFAGAGEAGTTGTGMGAVAGSSSIGFGLVCGILCLLSSSFVSPGLCRDTKEKLVIATATHSRLVAGAEYVALLVSKQAAATLFQTPKPNSRL